MSFIKEQLDMFQPVEQVTGHPRLPDDLVDGERRCGNCDKPGAKLQCSECRVTDIGFISSRYCSKTCQAEHWAQHKAACRDRRRLAHAVQILSHLWNFFSQATFTPDVKIVAVDGTVVRIAELNLGGSNPRALLGQSLFRVVPGGGEKNGEAVQQTILHCHAAYDLMVTGIQFIAAILKPLCSEITLLAVEPKNPALRVSHEGAFIQSNCHFMFHVRVPSGGEFAVDLSGMEYGWQEKLYTWETYVAHRSGNIGAADLWRCRPLRRHPLDDQSGISNWLANNMLATMFLLLASKGKGVRTFMSQKTAEFSVQADRLVSALKRELIFTIYNRFAEGLDRFFLNVYHNDNEKQFVLEITQTREMANRLSTVWFTAEQIKQKCGNPQALIDEWEERFGKSVSDY